MFGDAASREAGNAAAEGLETRGIDAGQVLRNWDAIKAAENASGKPGSQRASRLESVLRSTPALMEAAKLGSRASKAGFDWPDAQGLFSKIEEEAAELQEAVSAVDVEAVAGDHGVEEELGDLLFTVVNLARHLKVEPELALRRANAKFRRRFAHMEQQSTEPLEALTSDQLEALWARAKGAGLSDS